MLLARFSSGFSSFSWKKKFVKTYNRGSNFKDPDGRRNRFEIWAHGLREKIFWINESTKKRKSTSCDKWLTCSVALIASWGGGSDLCREVLLSLSRLRLHYVSVDAIFVSSYIKIWAIFLVFFLFYFLHVISLNWDFFPRLDWELAKSQWTET